MLILMCMVSTEEREKHTCVNRSYFGLSVQICNVPVALISTQLPALAMLHMAAKSAELHGVAV